MTYFPHDLAESQKLITRITFPMRFKIESLILLAAFVPASQAHALGAQSSNRAVVIAYRRGSGQSFHNA